MKKNVLFLALFLSATGMFAQKGVDTGTKYGSGQDSINCVTNYSLFTESAKHKNYAEALKPWQACYNECPQASVNIYIYGARIIGWEIENAATPADKQKYFDQLMALYGQRIKYYGTNPKHPEGYVLGLQALDYIEYRPEQVADIYQILKKSVDMQQEKSSVPVLQNYMMYTGKMYAAGSVDANVVMDNYNQVSGYITKDSTGKKLQSEIDQWFVSTGVANCETLSALYQKQLEANKADKAWLAKALGFMARAGCNESDLYFQIAELKHNVDPTSESALGLAQMYLKKKDYSKGMGFFEEAITRTQDKEQKAKYYFQMAQVAYGLMKSNTKAREYCLKAAENNSAWGAPYILIAQMYASSATSGSLGSKEMENRAGYWAAYDKAAKAKSVDASEENQKQADLLMSQYRQQFPTVETVFMDPDYVAGQSKHVGGWINESTIVRTK